MMQDILETIPKIEQEGYSSLEAILIILVNEIMETKK